MIGIEVHAQLVTQSKIFSAASTRFGAAPNTNASFVDAALPGTLPNLNAKAVEQAIRTGLGLNGEVQTVSKFERKHYFYCDMPQGYQITQQQFPIVRGGYLELDPSLSLTLKPTPVRVGITRIQLEQDSGKNIHDLHPTCTFVDLNRAGVGLMEIVSEPDLRSAEQAAAYIRKLSGLLQHLHTCRAHMEDGSLRCDVNVSVRRVDESEMGERVEVKNLNSIRSLQRAIDYEVNRQVELAERGEPVQRETRAFDAKSGVTILMRTKERMLDYRFSPEPDLPPLVVSSQSVSDVAASMPELPDAIAHRFQSEYGLSPYDTGVLLAEPGAPTFFDQLVYGPEGRRVNKQTDKPLSKPIRKPKRCVNWMTNELFGRLKKKVEERNALHTDMNMMDDNEPEMDEDDVDEYGDNDSNFAGSFAGAGSRGGPSLSSSPVSAATLGELIDLIEEGTISGKTAKSVLDMLVFDEDTRSPTQIVEDNKWKQEADTELMESLCTEVVSRYPDEVAAAAAGKNRIFGFLSGQVLKLAAEKGKAGQLNPAAVAKRMEQIVEKHKK